MKNHQLIIEHIYFTGSKVEPSGLDFKSGLNLIYGASNTGKSFVLKSIDYMLGGSTPLPDFKEHQNYDKVWLGFEIKNIGKFTLSRAKNGGSFLLYDGLIWDKVKKNGIPLSEKHNAKDLKNLSNFLLDKLGLSNKEIVKNKQLKKENLSFRDLAHMLIVDETSIQSERSPIETGQKLSATKERGVFKLLLTGVDDSALITIDENNYRISASAKLSILDQLICEVASDLDASYPDADDLPEQRKRLRKALDETQTTLVVQQLSIQQYLELKNKFSIEIPRVENEINETRLHINRFEKLNNIYVSDIQRLESLEEVSFFLSLGKDRSCSLCGAPPEAQKHKSKCYDIALLQQAANAEIIKIRQQQDDLAVAVKDLKEKEKLLCNNHKDLITQLNEVESEIQRLTPFEKKLSEDVTKTITLIEHINHGLELIKQKESYTEKKEELKKVKSLPKAPKETFQVPSEIAHQFSLEVSNVLQKWGFPGNHHVFFDQNTYDVQIDGKLRTNNGKGVRALIHAAFKVALLLFCHKNNLPNPGFLILDTPLLTYRDPLQNLEAGELSNDEKILANSDIKKRFFDHLASISDVAQFIIIENVDPPNNIESLAHIHAFYGQTGEGRFGLFPPADE